MTSSNTELGRGWLHVSSLLHYHEIRPKHHPCHLLPHHPLLHDLRRSQLQVLWRHLLRLAFSRHVVCSFCVWKKVLKVIVLSFVEFWEEYICWSLLGYVSCKEVTLARKYDYMEDHLFASLALIKHDFFR